MRSGALLGADYDPREVGLRAAELANEWFDGETLSESTSASELKPRVHVNESVARRLGVGAQSAAAPHTVEGQP